MTLEAAGLDQARAAVQRETTAPFLSQVMQIEPGWIDYNGHLNMAYYNVLFDRAVDEVFELLGCGADYVKKGFSTFTAEVHVRYLREFRVVDAVEVHQTHISVVFVAGGFAYKLKKPVRLPFLDFSSLAARRHFCEEELRLNRRMAAEIYLDVLPVATDASGRMTADALRAAIVDFDARGGADLIAVAADEQNHARRGIGRGVIEHGQRNPLLAR